MMMSRETESFGEGPERNWLFGLLKAFRDELAPRHGIARRLAAAQAASTAGT